MARYASGSKAWGTSDRSGFRYRLSEMVTEWNGLKVGPDEYEAKHPQLRPIKVGPDPQALHDPRPDQCTDIKAFVVYTNVGDGIIGQVLETFEVTASVGSVTVSTSCLLYTSPSPRDGLLSRMPSSA